MLKGVRVLEDVSSKHYFEEASWLIRQRFKHTQIVLLVLSIASQF